MINSESRVIISCLLHNIWIATSDVTEIYKINGFLYQDAQICMTASGRLRGRPKLSSFSQSMLGGGGQWSPCAFFKLLFMHCIMHTWSFKMNIFKVLF